MLRIIDWWLFVPALFLSLLGLLVIFSLSPEEFHSQLIYLGVALGVFLVFLLLDVHFLQPFSPVIYGFCILLLLATHIFGIVSHGSARWLGVGSFRFQPSELAKPLLALSFAFWGSRLHLKKGKDFLLFLLLFALPFGLIFRQPDLGSALVVVSLWGGVLLTRGINLKAGLLILILLLIIVPLSWGLLRPYQRARVETFLNPQADPLGASYNQIQATIAVGSGGFLGKGLGQGTQSQLQFLPEKQTDFIFANLSEELGFLGSFTVLFLYVLLFSRLLFLAAKAETIFAQLLNIGIFSFLWFQTVIHIGMNIGLLPVTGVTLPFISAGGSSLLATWLSLSLVMLVSAKRGKQPTWEIK